MSCLELYCGIGGLSAVLSPLMDPQPSGAAGPISAIRGVDINSVALSVYGHNFDHPTEARLVESLRPSQLEADLWWASPPCQPFTRRGLGRGLEDPRAKTFEALLRSLDEIRPRYFAFENVLGFEATEAHRALLDCLDGAGYGSMHQWRLCPSRLGWPNRRPRFYLVASQSELAYLPNSPEKAQGFTRIPLAGLLDPDPPDTDALWVEPDLLEKYSRALHCVSPEPSVEDSAGISQVESTAAPDTLNQPDDTVTHCFTSAYGRSPVRSGSYLRVRDGRVRRFSPAEILRLLGFPASFTLPPELPRANAWRLVGNSLSLPAVRRVLSCIPELSSLGDLSFGDSLLGDPLGGSALGIPG